METPKTGRTAIHVAALLLLALVGLSTVVSASTFTAAVPGDTVTDTAPVSLFSDGDGFSAFARAGATALGSVRTFVAGPNTLSSNTSPLAGILARSTIDDLMIVGPVGPGGTVVTTLHLPFHALFNVRREVWFGDFNFGSNVTANARFSASLQGNRGDVEVRIDPLNADLRFIPQVVFGNASFAGGIALTQPFSEFALPLTFSSGGIVLAGLDGQEVFGIRGEIDLPGNFPVGVPMTLDLSLSASTLASAPFIASADGTLDALRTFGVPQDGTPVFDLPPGFTSFSPTLGIVDNVVPVAAAVPEPATLLLLGIGVVAVLAAHRTHRAAVSGPGQVVRR